MYVASIEIALARFITYRRYDKVKGLDTTDYRSLSFFFLRALRFNYTCILSTEKRSHGMNIASNIFYSLLRVREYVIRKSKSHISLDSAFQRSIVHYFVKLAQSANIAKDILACASSACLSAVTCSPSVLRSSPDSRT